MTICNGYQDTLDILIHSLDIEFLDLPELIDKESYNAPRSARSST